MTNNIDPNIIHHLKKDKKLSLLIDHCTLEVHKSPIRVFDDLLRSIISQQLSTTAAATIYGRFVESMHNDSPIHLQILDMDVEKLRSLGLSYQKAGYVKNVCHHFLENQLFETDWTVLTDEEIIMDLTQIKGVGKWTVEMILMFSLYREDVLPLDDLIIRNHIIQLYDVQSSGKQLMYDLTMIADPWRPYRTYACRYLWAAKDSKYFRKEK